MILSLVAGLVVFAFVISVAAVQGVFTPKADAKWSRRPIARIGAHRAHWR